MAEEDSTVWEEEQTAEFVEMQAALEYNILRLDDYQLRVVLSFVEELLRE